MVPLAVNQSSKLPLRQPRLAEMVAAELRQRILSGALPDGSLLPKQEDFVEEFRVSPPSIREALMILETEGLVTVLRGNGGGAVVHQPQHGKVSYMIGLVLQSRGVELGDVASALGRLEPACAEACAERPDRDVAVLPRLRATLDAAAEAIDDAPAYAALARQFHGDIAATCGNETMGLVIGAMESLWSAQVDHLARYPARLGTFDDRAIRAATAEEHEQIYRHIAEGDGPAAAQAVRAHLSTDHARQERFHHAFDLGRTVEAAFLREG